MHVNLDPLERHLLGVAHAIADAGLSPNNNRLYDAMRGPACPTWQAVKRVRARLLALGLLPAPPVSPGAARVPEAAGFRVREGASHADR